MNDAVTGANDVAAAFNNTSYVQEQKLRESGIDKINLQPRSNSYSLIWVSSL